MTFVVIDNKITKEKDSINNTKNLQSWIFYQYQKKSKLLKQNNFNLIRILKKIIINHLIFDVLMSEDLKLNVTSIFRRLPLIL